MPANILDAAERPAIIHALLGLLHEHYVFPDMVPAIADRFDSAQRTGRYDTDNPSVFAELVGVDMRDVTGDDHLNLRFDPKVNAAARQSQGRDNGPDPAARQQSIRIHHGLVEQRILDGNVRYLRITDFDWIDGETNIAYDAAVRFLSDADAIIIDVRGNRGGEPAAVQYLVSHFMQSDVVLLTCRTEPEHCRTLGDLPAGRICDVPLLVLIDGNTYSAGEAFAYHVLHFGLGELVGVGTPGAANFNEPMPVGSQYMATISHDRPLHPVTGTNWEGVGVPPTIKAVPSQALNVAHAAALEQLIAADTTDELCAEYAWALVAVNARSQPLPPSDPAVIAAASGRYDPAEVAIRDGELWLIRPSRRDFRLVPLTSDGLYGADGNDNLQVRLEPERMLLHFRGCRCPRNIAAHRRLDPDAHSPSTPRRGPRKSRLAT